MDQNMITWIWLIVGIILILSELLIPGLVIVFFGASAVMVAILRWLDIITTWQWSFGIWIILSLLMVTLLRHLITKMFPPDSSYTRLEEDSDAYGTIVTVIETVNDENFNGRIKFQGSTWPAMSEIGTIEPGKKAKLLSRDNLAWIVEPYYGDGDETNLTLNNS